MVGEKLVESFNNRMKTIILRPATVCGISKNIRLDLTINMLTYHAIKKGEIIVFGGSQYRPNLTLIDMIKVYHFFINKNLTGIFNVGFENEKIIEIAKKISNKFKKINIKITKSNDLRSYRLSSQKLLNVGYNLNSNIEEEIIKLRDFYLNKKFKFSDKMIRINYLKKNINL
jgi:nucleoside-diphosphate-sugar epimerase